MQCMLNKEQRTPAGGVIPRALAPPGSPVPGARVLLLPEAGDRPPVFTFPLLGSSLTTDACFPKQRATRFAAFLMHYRLMNGGCKTSSFELFPPPTSFSRGGRQRRPSALPWRGPSPRAWGKGRRTRLFLQFVALERTSG